MIFVGVGTFLGGFDRLVDAADRVAQRLDLDGFAQIGHSNVRPKRLRHARFLDAAELAQMLAGSRVAVCHAGMGLIGDALRAGCRLIVMPRAGANTRAHPINDQHALAERLAKRLPIAVCLDERSLEAAVREALALPAPKVVLPRSDVPEVLRRFLLAAG